MRVVLRVIAILTDPFGEWLIIEKEPCDPAYLMISYVAPLVLVPAVFGFIGACVVGVVVPGAGTVRASLLEGVFGAIFGYLASAGVVLMFAGFISVAAPFFGGRRNFVSALKLAVYSYTPVWLAGIFLLLPGLHFLTLTGFYGVYILLAGLQPSIRIPAQQVPGFAALTVLFASGLTFIAASAQHSLFGTAG